MSKENETMNSIVMYGKSFLEYRMIYSSRCNSMILEPRDRKLRIQCVLPMEHKERHVYQNLDTGEFYDEKQ